MVMGGERRTLVAENEPRYSAVYEVESREVRAAMRGPGPLTQGAGRTRPGPLPRTAVPRCAGGSSRSREGRR